MNLETDIVCDRTKGCYEAIKVSPAAPRQKGSFSEVKLLPPQFLLSIQTNVILIVHYKRGRKRKLVQAFSNITSDILVPGMVQCLKI